jgi:hypothetical protein
MSRLLSASLLSPALPCRDAGKLSEIARSSRQPLSVEECRRLLGPDARLNDAEIEHLREQLYGLAAVVVEACERRNVNGSARDGDTNLTASRSNPNMSATTESGERRKA